jgi:Gpi18-like mannosyltransferase
MPFFVQWLTGTVLLSLGLSVKMNALLFVPGLLYLLARNVGMMKMVGHMAVMVLLQVCEQRLYGRTEHGCSHNQHVPASKLAAR